MRIRDLLKRGEKELKASSETALLDTEVLLSHVLKKSKEFLLSNRKDTVSKQDEKRFIRLLRKRRENMPIAYIVKSKEFYSLPFYVNQRVLIPRPETEELVDLAYLELKSRVERGRKAIDLVDLGTGCGCIGIVLIYKILQEKLNEKVHFNVFFTDISTDALEIAKKNYKMLLKTVENIDVKFKKTDLLSGVDVRFDVLASNLPYIPSAEIEKLDPSVRCYEPQIALDGGKDGIKIIKRVIGQARKKMKENGVILLEIYKDHPNLISFFIKQEFPEFKYSFIKDAFGQWRFAVIHTKKAE